MYYYPPSNKDYVLPPGETPPLIVKIHGGPTSSATTMLSLSYQYYTSRGGSRAGSGVVFFQWFQ
jgi:dipeptidyl aminopeptidase/acylaminoacyl peptidase